MNVFKNTDIAHEFNVSDPTVINWIQASLDGKNNLQLTKVKEKFKIIVNEHNQAELLRLSKISFSYRNKIQKSTVAPSSELYKILNQSQIIELINELKINKKVPLKFWYISQGGKFWDKYVNEGLKNRTYIVSDITDSLIEQSFDFLLKKASKFQKINIIDLGPGNGYALKNLLIKLKDKSLMGKYVAVDVSSSILEVAQKNVKDLLTASDIQTHNLDFERYDLSDILFESKIKNNAINFVFLAGGTYGSLENRSKFLKFIQTSLDDEDILIVSNKISDKKSKTELSHLDSALDDLAWIPKMLGINVGDCTFEKRYDTDLESRAVFLKLDQDYEIKFEVGGSIKTVNFFQGDQIRLWKHHMSTLSEVLLELEDSDLNLIHSTTTQNLSDLLFVCEPKKEL